MGCHQFFLHLKKSIPYFLAQLMEAYKDEALKPSTVKKLHKLFLENISKLRKVVQKMAVNHAHH